MAYMDDLLRELEARNLTGKIYNAGSSSSQSSNSTQKKKKKDYTEELLTILSEDAKKNGVKLELSDYGTISEDSFKAPMDDIAPVKTTVKKSEEADDGLLDFFQKGALGEIDLRKNFRDGYQFGDILKTGGHVAGQVGKAILGTAGDVGLGVAKGFASSAEGIADLASYGIAAGLDALGKDYTAERWRKNASENTVEEWTKGADEYLNRYSMAGRTTDAISQGIGQIGSIIATGGLGKAAGLGAKAVTALTTGTMGLSGAGAGMGEAYRGGASDEEAATYGLIAGASDALTELLFGGLGKAVGAVGLSTGLSSADDLLAKKVSGLFTNQIAKNFAEYGIKAGAEGFEEVLAGTAQAIGKKITYMKEEELSEILKDENLLEQFVVGAAASGLMQSGMIPGTSEGSLREANAQGRDFITGLNQNEQTVIDKEVEKRVAAEEEKSGTKLTRKEIGKIEKTVQEDMDKGYISIDTIEEALGGETYTNYKKVVDAEEKMQREYDELGKKEKYTLADDARYKELGERLKYVREKGAKNELRKRLDDQVSGMVKDSRLSESFAERSRRGQAFEADLTQYTDEKQRAIVQKAVDSGILNNTNRTREFVNMVSKIAADKDISFDFANNAKLKETGFAVEGKTVNGFVTKDGITVNIQSAKALNSVVGHEITHVLEGTELYTELQTAAIEYAKTKGDYQGRYDALVKVYESVEGADIDAELTADLVGDYLFTDSDFISNLSTNHRNVFQKIYDEVKYLLKVATVGSKEARELEKVKRAFDKAYRESTKNTAEDGGTTYSLEQVDGVDYVKAEKNLFVKEDGTPASEREVFKSLVGKTIHLPEGDVEIVNRLPGMNMYNELARRYPKNMGGVSDAKQLNSDVNRNMEELLDNSVATDLNVPDVGNRHAKQGITSFDTRTVKFYDGAKAYDVEFSIATLADGRKVAYAKKYFGYDADLTKKIQTAEARSNQSPLNQQSVSDGTVPQNGADVKYSLVEDQGTIDFLENQEHITTYKAMALIDGKLYPPMASQTYVEEEYTTKSGEKKTRRVRKLKSPSELGRWQQADERVDIAEKTYDPKKGYSSFDLLKSNGKTTGGVAYNPYEHTSNIVLNDQFSEAYQRPELVTVEYEIPVSELTSGYKAQYAKDPVGLTDWKAGGVAQKLKNSHRDVYLTRWSKPVRVLSDAEVAQKYKEILDKEDGVSVPWNVVTASLREELEKIGVPIDYSDIKAGSTVRSFEAAVRGDYEKPKKAKKAAKYSLAADSEGRQLSAEQREYFKDSKVVDENGNLLAVYHGSKTGGFSTFRYRKDVQTGTDYGEAFYFTSDRQKASGYSYDVTKDERVARYQKDRDALMKRFLETRSEADKNAFLNYKLDGKNIHELMNDEAYLTDGGEVKEVYLNLSDPLIADAGGEYYYKVYPEYFNQARENGNDGIIVKNVIDNPRGEARPIDVYIAFRPEQIKSVDNTKPTADPDIRRSLSADGAQQRTFGNYNMYGRDIALEEAIAPVRQDIAPATVSKNATVAAYEEPLEEESPFAEVDRLTEQLEEMERQYEATFAADEYEKAEALLAEMATVAVRIRELESQLDADVQERLASMEDADAPAIGEAPYSESTDTVTLPKKMVQDITRDARKALGFSVKQVPEMRTLVEKFSQGEIDSEQLHDEIAERFGTITETGTDEDVAEVKRELRRKPINVADDIKSSFADYTASVMRPNFGKIRFSNAKNADGVDTAYDELSDKYPGFFPKDIIQPADQLQRIIEVANMDSNTESRTELGEQFLDEVTDGIVRSVNEYKREQRLKMSEQNAFAAFNGLMRDADRYAPIEEGDIGPVRADAAAAAPAAEPVQESAPAAEQPIKTVKERLEAKLFNLQTELKRNQQLREESNAEYEQEIARLQTEYYEQQNKNTKAANNLLRRMERLRRIQSDVDADYAKRINDLSEQVAKVSEEARTGESAEAQGAMRRELHQRIVENIRAKFMERGYDLETVLKNAKDLSTFATVDNTPQRVMEKALGYKEGQILADLTVNQVAANETKGIRWLNSYTDRKNGLLAQISKQYNIKPGSKESAAAQMYAEGFYVNGKDEIVAYGDSELAQDFPDAKAQANIKGLARDPRIRQIYDATLAMINESRVRNAYPEIQKLDNYFLHFRAMDDTFSRLGIPFNPNDIRAKDLPTDLNGVTADLKPGQPYFASAMHRKGKKTSFDLLGGLEKYLTSAKGQIYHIDDIQTLRALRNHIADTYGQAHGLEGLDTMTEEEAAAQIEQVYDAHLSTFAKFLNEEANVIAGKTALIDRGLEGIIGRRGMTFFDTLNRQVGANMVGFNVSSSLTNFIAPVQAFAKTNKAAFVKGFAQTVAGRIGSIAGKTDGFIENNPTMIRRQGADRFYRTPWQKAGDLGYALMGAVDSISTEIVVRGKYNELVSKGMSAEQAVIEADKWASRLMGDRSLGQQPQLYNSKMAGLVTKFQLEVRNQLDSQFYDTIQEAKVSAEDIQNAAARNAKVAAKVTSTFVTLAVTQHLFGKVFESIAGYNPAFDIIEAIIKAFGWDDEEESEDTVLDNLGQGLMSLAEDMPYSSVLTDGGRIPISSALPITQLIKGEDKYGNEKSRWETIAETAPYYLLPGGYGQIKKTTQGLKMFDDDLPIAGSYTDSGNLRYPVEDTLGNRVQAAIFGQYASSNARDYFDNERQSLKKNQIQELVDVDIPIREYWDYRDGLKEQETLGEKFDYIAGLDLPIDKKNILINNVVDRKEAVDLTDYHDYADYEEFDFAVKNPEKYDFLQSVGVSVAEYNSFDDDTKDAYNWAYQNPEKYTLSRAVSDDVAVYRQYAKALNDISADKDADGKSISGSRKAKVIDYLNGLDADYYSKLILFKMEYNADDTYNNEIIEYLNGRNDISFEEEVTILRELGFTVTADGTVRW